MIDVTINDRTLAYSYDQDAFRNVLRGSSDGYHLTTKRYDPDIKLYYFFFRWYDPKLGRFIKKSPFPSNIEHPYTYAAVNPMRNTDPYGTYPYPFLKQNSNTGANDMLECAISVAKHLKRIFGPRDWDDKYKHCILGCIIQKICGGFSGLTAGVLKEIYDLLTETGNVEYEDIVATNAGAQCGKPCESLGCTECYKSKGYTPEGPLWTF